MRRKRRPRRNWGWNVAVALVKPPILVLTRREWAHAERLPKGGLVIVANHVSHLDPLTLGHFVLEQGRLPRFLAKASLFEVFFVKSVLRSMGQIPVLRETASAGHAFEAAVEAVRAGEAVVFYPEGTLTRDPELWPMAGKTGAARVALESGAPVVPIVQWGVHQLLYPYAKKPNLWPRKSLKLSVGDPIDLSDFAVQELTPEVLRQATDRIMGVLAQQLAELRGEAAPSRRFDPKAAGVAVTGNPHLDAVPSAISHPKEQRS